MDQEEYYYSSSSEEEESSVQHHPSSATKKKKKKKKNKRENQKRFSDEQVKLLESVFSHGSKLEPRKKLQLASDIGLEPRQVSIWFQNKRARWKTKQLEQEYKLLKNKFDDLYQKYDSLKKEKETLLDQFNRLRRLLENSCNEQHNNKNNSKNESEDVKVRNWGNRDQEVIKEKKEDMFYDEHRIGSEYFGQEDDEFHHQVLNFSAGQGGNLLGGPQEQQQQLNLVSTGCLLDEPCCPSSWWEL